MFKDFFDQQTLERANKFHNDIILIIDYRAVEKKNGDILTYRDRAKRHAYVPIGKIAQLELEINELKDSFLLRLAVLEDNEKGHSLEKNNQERESKLLNLQIEMNKMTDRSLRFTIGASVFAALATLTGALSAYFASLQVSEMKIANEFMKEQNQIMREQNEIASKTVTTKNK